MKARLLLRLRRKLRRLGDARRGRLVLMQPADTAWHDMLARINAAEAERRIAAAESALNRLG